MEVNKGSPFLLKTVILLVLYVISCINLIPFLRHEKKQYLWFLSSIKSINNLIFLFLLFFSKIILRISSISFLFSSET